MNKAIFLDRDGVINVDHAYVHRLSDWEWMPGIFDFLRSAKEKGFRLVIITNQSGIARGMFGHRQLQQLHAFMTGELEKQNIFLDAIYYCPHHPQFSGRCYCRKPGTLLFEKALARFDIDPAASWMIGDKERDILPARKLGITGIRLGTQPSDLATATAKTIIEAQSIIGC